LLNDPGSKGRGGEGRKRRGESSTADPKREGKKDGEGYAEIIHHAKARTNILPRSYRKKGKEEKKRREGARMGLLICDKGGKKKRKKKEGKEREWDPT